MFCALFSLLITCLMLFLDISHIALMFPFNWGKVVSHSHKVVVTFWLQFGSSISECVPLFRCRINIYLRIVSFVTHGFVCRCVSVGTSSYERYVVYISRKYPMSFSDTYLISNKKP